MARGKAKKASPVSEITSAVEDVLEQAQATLNRGLHAARKALPSGPDKVVQSLSKRASKAAKDLEKSRKSAVKRVEKTVNNLDRRRQRAVAAMEKRSSKLLDAAEDRAVKALRPIVKRLDIASQHDLSLLQARLSRLEHKVAGKAKRPRQQRARKRAAA